MTELSPAAAGFDGAKGIRLNNPHMPNGGIYRLRRGRKPPSSAHSADWREQLLWWMPDDQPARLLWCNAEEQWFELSFTPIDKP